jgi:hypothetical protein
MDYQEILDIFEEAHLGKIDEEGSEVCCTGEVIFMFVNYEANKVKQMFLICTNLSFMFYCLGYGE